MLELFLVLAKTTLAAVGVVLWLSSRERTVARLRWLATRWWRPALFALVLLPVALLACSSLGWLQLGEVRSVWLATLAGPLAGGNAWRSTDMVLFTVLPLAAIVSLPIWPRGWTFLLAGIGFSMWCCLGFLYVVFTTVPYC